MNDPRRYTEAELRQRLIDRAPRVEAAIQTALAINERERLERIAKQAHRLPDGRVAIDAEAFNALLSDLSGSVTRSAIAIVLNTLVHEVDG